MPRRRPDAGNAAGTLYVVATPIGNLEDITVRALKILQEVGLIAAEDTRRTGILLAHYGIATPRLSYHDWSRPGRLDRILDTLAAGTDVALVTDAGSPGISDPGYPLLAEAARRAIPVKPVPGPSAVIAALTAAALPTDRFAFVGFLPRRAGARQAALAAFRDRPETVVAYESPHRIDALLADAVEVLGERPAALCRELTKVYEEVRRGTLGELLAGAKAEPPRGELVLVIGGAPRAAIRAREAAARGEDAD